MQDLSAKDSKDQEPEANPKASRSIPFLKPTIIALIVAAFFGYTQGGGILDEMKAKGYDLETVLNLDPNAIATAPSDNAASPADASANQAAIEATKSEDVPEIGDHEEASASENAAGNASAAASDSDVPMIEDESATSNVGGKTFTKGDINEMAKLKAELVKAAGPYAAKGAMGAAVWYALSSLVGCITLLIPLYVYHLISKAKSRNNTAGAAIVDVMVAVVVKYAILAGLLYVIFKFLDLVNAAVVISLVWLMLVNIVVSARNVPPPEAFKPKA